MSVRPNVPTTIRISDFSGGKNTTISPSLLNDNEAVECINTSFLQKGTISPRRGRIRRYSTPFSASPVTGLGALYRKDGTTRLVVASGNALYSDSPTLSSSWDTQQEFGAGTIVGSASLTATPGEISLLPVSPTQTQSASNQTELNGLDRENVAVNSGQVTLTKVGTDYSMTDSVLKTIPVRSAVTTITFDSQADFQAGTHSNTSKTNVVGSVTLARV